MSILSVRKFEQTNRYPTDELSTALQQITISHSHETNIVVTHLGLDFTCQMPSSIDNMSMQI